MNLADRFNNWPPAIRACDAITSWTDRKADSASNRVSSIFTPIGERFMDRYLKLKPLPAIKRLEPMWEALDAWRDKVNGMRDCTIEP